MVSICLKSVVAENPSLRAVAMSVGGMRWMYEPSEFSVWTFFWSMSNPVTTNFSSENSSVSGRPT
jgi:hypothetical protein